MPLQQFPIVDFKGFYGKTSPFTIIPNGMINANNVHLSNFNGVVSKIGGYSKLAVGQTVTSGTAMDVYHANLELNAQQMIALTITNIYKLAVGDFTSIKSGLTGTSLDIFSYDIAIDDTGSPPVELILVTNGVDNVLKWDFASSPTAMADLGGSPPKSRQLVWWKRRVFFGYTIESGTDLPNRLRWSGIGDPEDHSSGLSGFRDLNLNNGEIIVKLIPFRDFMAVLCSESIVLITLIGGTDVISELRFKTAFGCIAPNSVFNLENSLIYMSRSGLVAFDGSNFQLISSDRWRMTEVDFQNFSRCNVGILKDLNQLYFSYKTVNSSDDNDKVLVFGFDKNDITFSDFSFAGFSEHLLGSDITWADATWTWASETRTWAEIGQVVGEPILTGLNTNGFVHRLNVGGNKDGSAMSAFFESGWMSVNSFLKRKVLHRVIINASKQLHNLTLKLFSDMDDTTPVKTETVVMANTSGNHVSVNLDIDLNFQYFKYIIENNNSDEPFDIHSIIFVFEDTEAIN